MPSFHAAKTAASAAAASLAIAALGGCARAESPGFDAQAATRVAMANPAPRPAEEPPAPPAAEPRPLPSRESLSDTVISARVKASLLSDPAMSGSDVSVNTDHGVVNLSGRVKSQEQAAIATSHAQRPDGVMRIENHLALDAG